MTPGGEGQENAPTEIGLLNGTDRSKDHPINADSYSEEAR